MKTLTLLLILLPGFIFISCNETKNPEPDIQFIHTVFFWLNDSVTAEDKATFEEGLTELGTVPAILKSLYGIPAGTPREVVDNSYDYALIVYFSDAESQDEYQVDPVHQEFVEKYNHLWDSVKVYDTILK